MERDDDRHGDKGDISEPPERNEQLRVDPASKSADSRKSDETDKKRRPEQTHEFDQAVDNVD